MEDKLMDKATLCEEVLKCDPKTAEKYYIYEKGFPYIMQGKSKRYLKSAVIEWLTNRIRYN